MCAVFAFDCFNTIFDISTVPDFDLAEYGRHVKQDNFEPFYFGFPWYGIEAFEDAKQGIADLQKAGFRCVAASNGDPSLIQHVSDIAGIKWNGIVDFRGARVYKPHPKAYREIIRYVGLVSPGVAAESITMVTANPSFGDIEGAQSCGMKHAVIYRGPNGRLTRYLVTDLARDAIEREAAA